MLFKDFVKSVLMNMGEYSNSGTLISENENKDYLLSITKLTNDSMNQIATLGKTNYKHHDISHLKPVNQLGYTQWNEERFHNDTDVIFQAVGTRNYSFQVGDSATVYAEEEINGIWTTLKTHTYVNTDGVGYKSFKDSLTLTSPSNNVRLRFSGDYYYPIRWVGMFKENLSAPIEFMPYVEYTLPSNFYTLDNVKFLHESRQYEDYAGYQFDRSGKKILLDWYEKGEFKVNYFAYPTQLTISDTNVHVADEEVVDIPDEFIESLTMQVCNKLKAAVDQKYDEADRFDNLFASNLTEATKNKQKSTGFTTIQSLSGW